MPRLHPTAAPAKGIPILQRLDEMVHQHATSTQQEMEQHREFHILVALFSGYPVLAKELDRAWMFRMMVFSSLSAKIIPVPKDWHHKMVSILATRSPDRAETFARDHVHYGRDHLLEIVRKMNTIKTDGEPTDHPSTKDDID